MSIQKMIDALITQINKHNIQYYVFDNPVVSDQEYDNLLSELKKLEEEKEWLADNIYNGIFNGSIKFIDLSDSINPTISENSILANIIES